MIAPWWSNLLISIHPEAHGISEYEERLLMAVSCSENSPEAPLITRKGCMQVATSLQNSMLINVKIRHTPTLWPSVTRYGLRQTTISHYALRSLSLYDFTARANLGLCPPHACTRDADYELSVPMKSEQRWIFTTRQSLLRVFQRCQPQIHLRSVVKSDWC